MQETISVTPASPDGANTGWLYYKKYYAGINFTAGKDDAGNKRYFNSINNIICDKRYKAFVRKDVIPGAQSFILATTYPGLVTGTGYMHETGKAGESKIGFYFDHTTGLPSLPGHSVKGMLRSYFPQWENKSINHQLEKQAYILNTLSSLYSINFRERMANYLKQYGVTENIPYQDRLFMALLEASIFDGKVPLCNAEGKWLIEENNYRYKPLGIYQRDIFLSAEIIRGGQNDKFMGMDTLAPHPHPFKEPVPLLFIKVIPEVHWQFQFHFKNSLITAEEKKGLFHHLLLQFGIGAKTSVNYGRFKPR